MRIVKNPQAQFGQVDIADIQFDARSRDDIPALLKGLQYIYTHGVLKLGVSAYRCALDLVYPIEKKRKHSTAMLSIFRLKKNQRWGADGRDNT